MGYYKMNKVGRIEVIIGCMFAGKTSECYRYNRYVQINKSTILINHESDKSMVKICM